MIKIIKFKNIKSKKIIKLICICVIFPAFLSLAGCTGMNSKFGCNAVAGDSCTPVSVVNERANAGDYDNVQSGSDVTASQSSTQTYGYPGENVGYNVSTPMAGQPIRFAETVQRIWLAPYEDNSGNYHEPSYVYTVLQKPHWIGLPAKEVSSSNGN